VSAVIGSLSISDGAQVSSSTNGPGRGGDVSVNAESVRISGTGAGGIFAESLGAAAGGAGGAIKVDARLLTLSGSGLISSQTHGSGVAGSVDVSSDSVLLLGPETAINSLSLGSGAAGSVAVDAGARLLLQQGVLSVKAGNANAGDLTIRRRRYAGARTTAGQLRRPGRRH
jgi:hypothetical protein